MKVIKQEPDFKPITIVIETAEELELFIKNMKGGYNDCAHNSKQEYQASEILKQLDPYWVD